MKSIKFKNFICLLLVAVFAATVFGCGSGGGTPPPTIGGDPSGGDGGEHNQIIRPTGEWLLYGGETEYKIVTPAGSNDEFAAAADIKHYFLEATGFELPIIDDAGLTYSAGAEYISLGDTTLFRGAEVSMGSKSLGSDGFRIVTVGKSVFIAGGSAIGTRYGAHEFLDKIVNFEYLHPTAYAIDKGVGQIPLMEYDITEIPDFPIRLISNGNAYKGLNMVYMRQVTNRYALFFNANNIHNDISFVGASASATPTWISTCGHHLCYTARGNATQREAMLNAALETSKNLIKSNSSDPEKRYISITLGDTETWCSCPSCTISGNYYGANSGTQLKFMNDLNVKLRAWFATAEGMPYARDDIRLVMIAYMSLIGAPNPERIQADDGVAIWLAPIKLDFTASVHADVNKSHRDNMAKWGQVASDFITWMYDTNFPTNYMIPYDTFTAKRDLYRYLLTLGNIEFMWSQGQHGSNESTSWTALKSYLDSKFQWNASADTGKLLDRFFAGYFQEAAEPMRAWFDNMQVYVANLRLLPSSPYGGNFSVWQNLLTPAYWSRGVLTGWMKYADDAITAIEPLKAAEPERYQAIYDRICLERLSPLYMLMALHSPTFSEAELQAFRAMFKEDALRTGLTELSEGGRVENYWADWVV